MSTPAPELSPGTALDGYTLGAKVRVRSGAATYAAKDSSGRDVHVTVYADACFPTPLVRERSLRELRQLQAVDAPQLAKVLDCGKFGEGGIYEVGEVVSGESLAEVGQLGRPEVSATMNAIGEALLAAQKVGVIHRNLGAHVVIGSDRGVKVLGFAVGEPQGGPAFGPIDSIAPEQISGKVVDQRTLIYNLAAIAHQLLTGRPIFEGSGEQKLDLHLNAEPTGSDAALGRALAKDPRMRPMMLKQFVGDLAKLGGSAAAPAGAGPTASKPSARGWTMFMDAQPAAPAPASAAPAVAAPTPSAPVPAPSAPAPAPSAPAPTPATAPAQPAPAQPAGSKPSVRGWTMFMEAEGEQPAAASAPAPAPTPAPAPAPAAKVPAPVPAPGPAPAPAQPAGSKPSVRGWTMFMEAEGEKPAASAPEPAPAVAQAPAPTPAPAVAPAAAEPTKRGWTMFMEGEQQSASAPEPVAAPVVAAPVAPAPAPASPAPAPAGAEAKPTMRGWTMFMEGETGKPASAEAAAPAPASTAPASTAPASAPGEASTAPSTRGWTMFMEAQLPAGQANADAPAAASTPAPAPTAMPAPAAKVGSDAKGWTIFVERPADLQQPPDAAPQPAPTAPVAAAPVQPVQSAAQQFEDVAVSSRTAVAEEAPARSMPVSKQTVVMQEPPVIGPPPSMSTQPAVRPQPSPTQRPNELPDLDDDDVPKSKTGLIIGVAAIVILIVVIAVVASM